MKPLIKVADPVACEIVIAPRANLGDCNDHYDWCGLAYKMRKAGFTLAVVGIKNQSQLIEADHYSWDYERGDIRLLAGARLAVTLDSGVGHLASLLNTPQLVIYNKIGDENAVLEMRTGKYNIMRFNDMADWNNRFAEPVYTQEQIMEYVMSEIVFVTDAEIEVLKGQSTDIEAYYRSPSATLIMRPGGNEYRRIPSLATRVKSLATVAVAAATSAGPILAPDAMIENRLSICKACPYHGETFCRSCGCVTAAKVRLSASHCPEGKWRSL